MTTARDDVKQGPAMTIKQVAERAQLSTSTVYQDIYKGTLKTMRRHHRAAHRISEAQFTKWMEGKK